MRFVLFKFINTNVLSVLNKKDSICKYKKKLKISFFQFFLESNTDARIADNIYCSVKEKKKGIRKGCLKVLTSVNLFVIPRKA